MRQQFDIFRIWTRRRSCLLCASRQWQLALREADAVQNFQGIDTSEPKQTADLELGKKYFAFSRCAELTPVQFAEFSAKIKLRYLPDNNTSLTIRYIIR